MRLTPPPPDIAAAGFCPDTGRTFGHRRIIFYSLTGFDMTYDKNTAAVQILSTFTYQN